MCKNHLILNYKSYCLLQDIVSEMKAEGYEFPAVKESDAMFSADTAPQWVNADACHRCRVGFTLVVRKVNIQSIRGLIISHKKT